ncbi:MAG: hypothetical protein IKM38_04705 [Christensenellaceae bacterium]|nr:hypothetical protein [Christensenellaceae bacterium]
MNAENWITLLGIAFVFAGTCITAAAGIRKSDNALMRKIESIEARDEKNSEHIREQYLCILRLTVMSEEMPISERIIAGKKYIDEGGNGDVKEYYYNHLLPEHTK